MTHFVGGPRAADATYFSFKNDQLDRYFFEIEGGVATTFADSTTALIGGPTIVGNELYNSYSSFQYKTHRIGVPLSMPFASAT